MNKLINPFLLMLLACEEAAPEQVEEPAEELSDVEDIPTPSDNIPEEEEDNDSGNDDTPPEPVTVNYDFDEQDSLLYVQVYKDPNTAAAGMAHDHVMRASNWNGSVSYNVSDISKCAMQFSLPVDDLQVDEDAMREYVGYGDTISSSDRATIREHMLADDQLNAASYPTISFVSSSCQLLDDETIRVTGDMTIRNTTRQWDIDIDFTAQSERFYMSSVIDFTHSDFNITPYSAFWGAVRNSEPLKISFDMVGAAN